MKTLALFVIGLSVLSLAGCKASDGSDKISYRDSMVPVTPYSKVNARLDNLIKSCDGTQSDRLAAADSVMELIVKTHTDKETGKVIFYKNDKAYQIGKQLYSLTMKFYNNEVTQSECKNVATNIKYSLNSVL